MAADWVATYRLQLHAGFTLDAAASVLGYLADLGISHVYLSPILQAVPGSLHGYDQVDPTRVNDELGGEAAWTRFVNDARRHGLGILLDHVPNHMAAASENRWWEDVLAHGPYSAFASYFDIFPRDSDRAWRLHLSPLGKAYGEALAAGELNLVLRDGRPRLTYFDRSWPVGPAAWDLLVGAEDDASWSQADGPDRAAWDRRLQALQPKLEAAAVDGSLDRNIAAINADRDRLDAVVARQFYVLHSWKLEGEMINYRRFFDVPGLVGLRQELPEVFARHHRRIEAMVAAGEIDGLRVDHPDGLYDPPGYLRRLRSLLPEGRIYVEKILDADERLRGDWPVDGTVGYEFLNHVNRLWMDDRRADAFNAAYADFTGHSVNFPKVVREMKRQILDAHFASELDRLTDQAMALANLRWQTRDLSRIQMREAIALLTIALPVYRTYRTEGPLDPEDARLLSDALNAVRVARPGLDPAVTRFLEAILLAKEEADEASAAFASRWQQLTPAVAAKGVEDTAFYTYDRLVSCNEVGGQASLLGIPAETFHAFCHHLADTWPGNLLATSTHDNKRSEDVRARISVLTEIPERWTDALNAWAKLNEPAWKGRSPDRHAEYLLYQTLIGTWPISFDRCWTYMLKACREAKLVTSWHEPNAGYEEMIREFVEGILGSPDFVAALEAMVDQVKVAAWTNGLAQTLIKLTAPGVPDFYQGCETWDLSLVDPDNRRPVDFAFREKLLAQARAADAAAAARGLESGLAKLWLIDRVLDLRREASSLFARGAGYRPLLAQGAKLRHLVAFERGERVITLVPRFTVELGGDWADTRLRLPDGVWRNRLTDESFEGERSPAELFGVFPVALLMKEEER